MNAFSIYTTKCKVDIQQEVIKQDIKGCELI